MKGVRIPGPSRVKNIAIVGTKPSWLPNDVDVKGRGYWIKGSREHNEVKSKFGDAKRLYGLDMIMCIQQKTSETEIMIQFMGKRINGHTL